MPIKKFLSDLLGLCALEPRLEVLKVQEKNVHPEHASPNLRARLRFAAGC